MSQHNTETTDAQEAEFRRVIRPLIVVIGAAIKASQDLAEGVPIGHHEQNIEDALTQIVKHCAESNML